MTLVHFTINRRIALPSTAVFAELIDWRGHARWVPMTRVNIEHGDGGVGTVFVATTGLGPLALPDRMRVDELDAQSMHVRIAKIGPVLTGDVVLAVNTVDDSSCDLHWDETVHVPVLPQILAGAVGAVASVAFTVSINTMAKKLRKQLRTQVGGLVPLS